LSKDLQGAHNRTGAPLLSGVHAPLRFAVFAPSQISTPCSLHFASRVLGASGRLRVLPVTNDFCVTPTRFRRQKISDSCAFTNKMSYCHPTFSVALCDWNASDKTVAAAVYSAVLISSLCGLFALCSAVLTRLIHIGYKFNILVEGSLGCIIGQAIHVALFLGVVAAPGQASFPYWLGTLMWTLPFALTLRIQNLAFHTMFVHIFPNAPTFRCCGEMCCLRRPFRTENAEMSHLFKWPFRELKSIAHCFNSSFFISLQPLSGGVTKLSEGRVRRFVAAPTVVCAGLVLAMVRRNSRFLCRLCAHFWFAE
jgi:hypothetical protein